MIAFLLLTTIWMLLMWRSVSAEFRYYAAVKSLAPEIWLALGAPRWFKLPLVFASKRGIRLLDGIANERLRVLAGRHRLAARIFLGYTVCLLAGAIAYLKLAA